VLVADDDHPLREAITEVLEREGHRVISAVDGQHALDQLAQGAHPCAILLDWMMPRVDGEAFLTSRAASASLSSIPVFVISATHSPATDARIQGFLQKPFSLDDLLTLVRGVCKAHCDATVCRLMAPRTPAS
jgi:two-component system, OmpR family, response regulator MprA